MSFTGQHVALFNSSSRRFVQIRRDKTVGVLDEPSAQPGKLEFWRDCERFLVVDAGSGHVAFFNPEHQRFLQLRDEGHGWTVGVLDEPSVNPGNLESWRDSERFRIVPLGDGKYAIHNAKHNRFIRVHDGSVDARGGPKDFGKLPPDCNLERFEVVAHPLVGARGGVVAVVEAPVEVFHQISQHLDIVLTSDDRHLLRSKSEEGWKMSNRKERTDALASFPIHKLLCGIRHEFFFLYEKEGRKQIEDTTKQFSRSANPREYLQDPHHSVTKHLFINVIGKNNRDGMFEIENINLMDGNRRATSMTLNYIRGLLVTSTRRAPCLGDVDIHPLINGFDENGRLLETWIPSLSLIKRGGLTDERPRGDDNSKSMRCDIGFDSELVEEGHRGRLLGKVAMKLNEWYDRK